MLKFYFKEDLEVERKKSKYLEELAVQNSNRTNELGIENMKLKNKIDNLIKLIEQYDTMIAIVKKPDEEGIFGFNGNFGIKEELLNLLKGDNK